MPLQNKSSYNLLLCHGNYIIELKNWQYLVACLPGASLPTAVLTYGVVSVAGWSATTPYRLTAGGSEAVGCWLRAWQPAAARRATNTRWTSRGTRRELLKSYLLYQTERKTPSFRTGNMRARPCLGLGLDA